MIRDLIAAAWQAKPDAIASENNKTIRQTRLATSNGAGIVPHPLG
jgi:hypothetical protein